MTQFDSFNFKDMERQEVREYWEHEAHEFTPWLAADIKSVRTSHLEDVLGLEMEVIEVEKRVGRYSVDILARTVIDGRRVVIENQLTPSDHDHLGKAIAYAAGVNAEIIVWIAPRFYDEHRDAVQWLNNSSREGVDMFALRLEVWKIGESDPAMKLDPVEKPSEWKEKARRAATDLSESEERREEFWTRFRNRIEEEQTPLRPRKPLPRLHYSNPIGKAGYHLYFAFDVTARERHLGLVIEDDEDAYFALESQQEQIEAEIGQPLLWIEPSETQGGKMRSQIQLRADGSLEDRTDWEKHIDWFLEYGERFHEVFSERVQRL